MQRDALKVATAALGPDNSETAVSLTNLADLLREVGRFEEAEPLYREALAIYEAALGRRHAETAIAMNNLAALLMTTGRYQEAEPLMREVLDINREVLGPEHPENATTESNLAQVMLGLGRTDEAEALLRDALALQREAGADADVGQIANNLGGRTDVSGRYDEAEPLLREALAASSAQLGNAHPTTAKMMSSLGVMLNATGRDGRGRAAVPRRAGRPGAALGRDNADTALSMNNLGAVLRDTGRTAEAEPLFAEALGVLDGEARAGALRRPGWWPPNLAESAAWCRYPGNGAGQLSRALASAGAPVSGSGRCLPHLGDEPMPITLYDLTVPVFLRGLGTLDALLEKGRAHAEAEGIDARGAAGGAAGAGHADAVGQVQRASDTAKFAAVRIGGVENRSFADEETSFDDLHARIAGTRAFLEAVPRAAIDGREGRRSTPTSAVRR